MSAPTLDEVKAFIAARDPHTVHGALGVRVRSYDGPVLELDVGERLFQHAGIVHGGIYVLLAESAASFAAAMSVDIERSRVVGQEISASHLRAATAGVLVATARAIHRGRTSHVYAIDVENEVDGEKRLVSTCRCTLAIRPL